MRSFIKNLFLKISNCFLSVESISGSKAKWSELARKNALHCIWSEKEWPTEEEFSESGQKDYDKYVKTDTQLQQYLKKTNAKKVLEIGCGVGRMTRFFGNDFEKIYGIDIAPEMIEKAKKRLVGDKFVLLEGNGVELPVDSDSVDFVFSFIVFQHMPSLEIITSNFEEVLRVLKPGGIFKVQLRGNEVSKSQWFYGKGFTVGMAEKLAHATGFEILRIEKETERYLWLLLAKA